MKKNQQNLNYKSKLIYKVHIFSLYFQMKWIKKDRKYKNKWKNMKN